MVELNACEYKSKIILPPDPPELIAPPPSALIFPLIVIGPAVKFSPG
jgi:hypothetical protein